MKHRVSDTVLACYPPLYECEGCGFRGNAQEVSRHVEEERQIELQDTGLEAFRTAGGGTP